MLESFEFLKPNIEETIFESKPGVNDKVLHFAFISPYLDDMEKKNISTGITYYDCCELEKNYTSSQNWNT
jgi:hypothetical protein